MTHKLNGSVNPMLSTLGTPSIGCAYGSVSLEIENNVNPTDKYVPLTGLYSVEDSISGWLWDRRRLENELLLESQHNSFIGGHVAGLTDGSWLEQWMSGTVEGVGYHDIAHYRRGEFLTWTPRVNVGAYAIHHDRRTLFSDYSLSSLFSTDAIDNGVMWHLYHSDAVLSTIEIALYSRDKSSRIFKKIDFEQVEEFTGQISGITRLATTDVDGNILWANLESRKPEFIVDGSSIYLNGDYSYSIGDIDTSSGLLAIPACAYDTHLESGGTGAASGRDVFTRLFPVQSGSVRVRTKDPADNLDEWTESDNLDFSQSTDKHFSVDYDLGIITMGGFQAPSLLLRESLEVGDTEILVYIDEEAIAQYPDKGILVIGGEKIAYYNRTRDTFYNCIRGFDGTTTAGATIGTLVEDVQHGAGTSDELYLAYTAVPRIEYEVTDHDLRSANKSPWLDIRPGANVDTHDILQILSADVNLQEVILETDSEVIGGLFYGPIFYGTDVSRMTARGLDALGNPVEDIDLTIEILDGEGSLNGAGKSFTDESNPLGEIYSLYNSPYTKENIEKTVSAVTHVGSDTTMTVDNIPADTKPDDVWVFQILKHDKTIGTVGDQLPILAAAVAVGDILAIAAGYIDVDGLIDPESFKNGWLSVVGTGGITYVRNIVSVFEELDINDQPFSRIYMEQELTTALVTGQLVRLYEPEAAEWNASALNGTRHIVYEWRTDVTHPITGDAGAYYPLQPDSIVNGVFTFLGRSLPLPDKNDNTSNLGAYVVITPGIATLQAYGRDPMSGRVVRSNIIKLELDLPNSLVGVDSSGVLPVPYGWTFPTEEFNIGSGIGGANFITINPAASGINQFSVLGIFP